MPLGDYIERRRVLEHGARRFIVRRPRWSTVHVALRLYGRELVAIAKADALDEDGQLTVEDVLKIVTLDERAVEVLETCVETTAPPHEWPLRELALTALSLADGERLKRELFKPLLDFSTTLDDEKETVPTLSPDYPGDQEITATVLGMRFGISPHQVLDWPCEAVFEARDCLKVIDRRPDEKGQEFDTLVQRFAAGDLQ